MGMNQHLVIYIDGDSFILCLRTRDLEKHQDFFMKRFHFIGLDESHSLNSAVKYINIGKKKRETSSILCPDKIAGLTFKLIVRL